MTVLENVALPGRSSPAASARWPRPGPRDLLDLLGLADKAKAAPGCCPAASASAWPSPAPWPTSPPCCWPTSPPARSTPRAGTRSSSCSAACTRGGQTILMVTHDDERGRRRRAGRPDAGRPDRRVRAGAASRMTAGPSSIEARLLMRRLRAPPAGPAGAPVNGTVHGPAAAARPRGAAAGHLVTRAGPAAGHRGWSPSPGCGCRCPAALSPPGRRDGRGGARLGRWPGPSAPGRPGGRRSGRWRPGPWRAPSP